jgi:ABC-type transport system involved in cytochrome bd biosynthesis fused ATPase/permease subunit
VLGNVYLQHGQFDNAMAEYERVLELSKGVAPVEISMKAVIAHAYAKVGKRGKAKMLLNELLANDEKKENKMLLTKIGKQLLETKDPSSVIDENGANLSGGEKQKIAALRTAFQDANVFVLDEITSNVDPECAKEIYELFLEKSKEKITFIISHDDLPSAYANKTIQVV